MLGADWAADEYALGLARDARQRRHVVARRRTWHITLAACSYHWAWCNGGPIARWSWCGRVCGMSAAERCVGGGAGRSSPGRGLRVCFWTVDCIGQLVRTVFWRQMVRWASRVDRSMWPTSTQGPELVAARGQDPACALPNLENLVGDDGVRGTSRPQPPPSEIRYTAPSSIFGMTAAQRGASAPLRGSPLTQADAAGRVISPTSQSRLGTRRGAWVVISGREVCQPV